MKVVLLSACLFVWPVQAQSPSSFAAIRAALPETHVDGRIRAHFATTGEHAVETTDRNRNGIPDQVEDGVIQTRAAWLLLIDGLGFPDPFQSPRYEGVAFLDIHFLCRETLGSNGVAYDEIQRLGHRGDPDGTRSLCFDVATTVRPTENLTPAHELFHIIQNSSTYFKNRWFTEGTARWSEYALGKGGLGEGLRGGWPPRETVLSRLDEMAYEAARLFWEPLTLSVDKRGQIPAARVPAALKTMRHTDGSPVLKDLQWHGWEVIRDIIIALGTADKIAAAERGLIHWPEDEQKSPRNTPFILRTVEEVAARQR